MTYYKNGCSLVLMKLGFDAQALKALLLRSALSTGAGAAAGGVIDSENPLRGAALGAAGGLAGHGLGEAVMKRIPTSPLASAGISPFVGAAGGAAASGGARLMRGDSQV